MEGSRAIVQVGVLVSWILPAPAFIRGRATSGKGAKTRDSVSRLGIAIQGLAFGLSWMGPWWFFGGSRVVPTMQPALAILTVCVAFAGAFLVLSSVRTLGKEWSLTARITEGHRLVTSGPYSIVRNPIYTGMWGLQLGTCMAFSAWWAGYKMVAITAAIYYAGTAVRVRREEKLLRAEFGSAFDEYARRVPAIIPVPGRRR